MRHLLKALGLLVVIGQPLTAQEVVEMEVPEGWPWKMGEASVVLDGQTRPYTSYDFSIGAFDASVQFRDHYDCSGSGACKDTGKVLLALGFHPGTDHQADIDVIHARAVFPRLPKGAAKTRDVEVEWRLEDDFQGRKWLSKGPAKVKLTAVERGRDGSDSYGHLTGTLTATICEAVDESLVPDGECHSLAISFDSDVQYDSL